MISPLTYLQSLTVRLAEGLEQVPAEVRSRHGSFLTGMQRPDGGFAGREGESDLYYTSFALRSLAILGELYGPVAEHAAAFLRTRLAGPDKLIDRMSLVFGATQLEMAAGIDVLAEAGHPWKTALANDIHALRCADGGFAKGPGGTASSTYHTFLALLCLQLIDCPVTDPESIVRFLKTQWAEGGGFREIRVSKRAGTNPTAAAVSALRMLDAIEPDVAEFIAEFLCEMQDDDGGLLANSRIPLADLLSTFTGLLTLVDLGRMDALDTRAAWQFVQALDHPDGGFRAAAWDDVRDVEYTFYGLGSLALLWPTVT